MDSRKARLVRVLIAVLALSAPAVAALYLAARQSYTEQANLVSLYANDVLRRGDDSAEQVGKAIEALSRFPPDQACSDDAIALMTSLHTTSDRLQTVGHVSQGRLMCSSLGRHGEGLPLPPPTYVSRNGYEFRTGVAMPWSPELRFLLATHRASGYTAVIHPRIPVDVARGPEGLSVGFYGLSSRKLIISHGPHSPDWYSQPQHENGKPFVQDGRLIVIHKSPTEDHAAYAALPYTLLNETLVWKAAVLVPLALLAGGVIAVLGVQAARRQVAMPALIRAALARNEFFIAYQPIVRLSDGHCVGAEALVRWRRPTGELVRPDLFIPVAEDSGLIKLITRRVLELVAQDAGDLFARHPHFHLAINLSSADLHDPATVDVLRECAAKMKAGPGNLVVEATERGFIEAGIAARIVADIRALGIQVAIDDFGTGYSSLAHLESISLDHLKIDKCFVDTIGREAATSQVILHIIGMAKGLQLGMIAEGVETAEQAEFLRGRGVEHAQGWHFGKPEDMAQLRSRLEAETGARPA